MKVLKVITLASAFCFALAGICLANPVFPDGDVSAISTIDSFTAVTGLDFDNNATYTTVASITVSNNHEKAWDLQLPMTAIRFQPTGGTRGSGINLPGTITLAGTNPASFKYECGGTQSTATVGYVMDIQCSWSASTALLQGTYRESITATLTIGDGD
jgi:hypothetical protein